MVDFLKLALQPSKWYYLAISFQDKDDKEYYEVGEILEHDQDGWSKKDITKWITSNYQKIFVRGGHYVYNMSELEYDPNGASEE